MEWISDPSIWIALLTLTTLEVVLGVDNVIFISIIAGKLPVALQAKARRVGLILAMGLRIILLLSISWIIGLTSELFTAFDHEVTGRDIILLLGGLFLLTKATHEIHQRLEGEEAHGSTKAVTSFKSVIIQILLLDMVFSIDSVITAVGMVEEVGIMIAAVVIAVGIMLFSAGTISSFIQKHPTLKMLALAFLLLIGMSLVAEGLGQHIPKGYVYFAMAFSIAVESLNIRAGRKHAHPILLHDAYKPEGAASAKQVVSS